MPKVEIHERIERTDRDVDNSAYVLKVPYTHTDDFCNEGTFYRKVTVAADQIDAMEAELEERKRLPDLSEEEEKVALLKAERDAENERFESSAAPETTIK